VSPFTILGTANYSIAVTHSQSHISKNGGHSTFTRASECFAAPDSTDVNFPTLNNLLGGISTITISWLDNSVWVIVASQQESYTLNRSLNQDDLPGGRFPEKRDSRIMTLKEIIAYCLVVALGLILIIHFSLFWVYGGVFIYESNKIILALETLMSIGIIGFGFERLISTSIKKYNKKAQAVSHAKVQKQDSADQKKRGQAPQPILQQR